MATQKLIDVKFFDKIRDVVYPLEISCVSFSLTTGFDIEGDSGVAKTIYTTYPFPGEYCEIVRLL